jgi:phosphopantetheine adenylyltransferase
MSNLFQTVVDFFAPKPPVVAKRRLIEAVNDCGEKRYIEVESSKLFNDRRENLEVLFTKCKRLLSFVRKKNWDETMYTRVVRLHDDVRLSMYKNDDITHLFEEFESVENFFKGSSKSRMNLSSLDSV